MAKEGNITQDLAQVLKAQLGRSTRAVRQLGETDGCFQLGHLVSPLLLQDPGGALEPHLEPVKFLAVSAVGVTLRVAQGPGHGQVNNQVVGDWLSRRLLEDESANLAPLFQRTGQVEREPEGQGDQLEQQFGRAGLLVGVLVLRPSVGSPVGVTLFVWRLFGMT